MRPMLLCGTMLLLVPSLGVAQIFELYRPKLQAPELPADQDTQALLPGLPAANVQPAPDRNVCSPSNSIAVLERAFLDMTTQGQAQASAQVVRICIGEPGKFALPLYFLAGATGGAAGAQTQGEATASTLLNPLGGNLALALNDDYRMLTLGDHSFLRLTYTVAGRYLHMTDSAGVGVPLVVGTFAGGLRLQTAAWSPGDTTEGVGTAWLQLTVAGDVASKGRLATIFGPNATNWATSINVDMGVKVSGRLNAKISLYHALNDHGIAALRPGVVKVGFDFQTAQ